MEKTFFDAMQPNLMERLGNFYNRDCEYKQALKEEIDFFKQLEGSLSEEQLQAVKNYHDAICRTSGVCEMLAYRQGMRDLAGILGIESKGNNGNIY